MNSSGCHAEHRKRMRERYFKNGISAFEEHEILEVLLYYSITRKNTNGTAHKLLDRFGSIADVLIADASQLCEIEDVGNKTAIHLNFLGDTCGVIVSEVFSGIPLNNDDRMGMYSVFKIGVSPIGSAFVVYIDKNGKNLMEEWLYVGKKRMADASDMALTDRAEKIGADVVLIAHDHRGEAAEASPEDSVITDNLRAELLSKGIKLRHVIVCDNGYIFI